MKTLIIMRHASPAAQGLEGTDFTRPLTAQGQIEASLQGGFLREADIVPELIAASTALRALSTAELLAGALHRPIPVVQVPDLYNAPGETLLHYVQALPERTATVLLVAHMPGVAELVGLLASNPRDMTVAFSPALLVGLAFGALERWAAVVPGSATLEWLLPPLQGR